MNRRGFLRSGAVVGMAGALLGVGASEAKASGLGLAPATHWIPSAPGAYVAPPPIPEPRTINSTVGLTNTVTMRGGYDWPRDGAAVRVVEDSFADLHVTVDGKPFLLTAYRSPEEV